MLFKDLALPFCFAAMIIAAPAAQGQNPGGANYAWHQVDVSPAACIREPYGIIANYNDPTVRATVISQLNTMRSNGMQRLRIPIFHMRGHSTGTVMRSNGGNLSSQDRQNLTNFLDDIDSAGFVELTISFHPIGDNNPANWRGQTWTPWNESLFQENWNLIYNLMPIFRGSGIQFKVDLGNELAPLGRVDDPNTPMYVNWSEYTRKLYWNFLARFNRTETVGFSFPSNSDTLQYRIPHINYVYGSRPPYLYDVHIYGVESSLDNPNDPWDSAYDKLIQADRLFDDLGINSGFIIGEAHYNSADTAQQIQRARRDANRTVFHLYQWPVTRNGPTGHQCNHASVAPPSDYNNYRNNGF
jgi:hypothetical protein